MSSDSPSPDPAVSFDRVGTMVRQLTHDVRNGLNSMELQAAYITDLLSTPEEGADVPAELKRLRGMFADQGRQLQRFAMRFRLPKPEPINYPAGLFVDDFRERLAKLQPAFAPKVGWTVELGEEVIAVDAEMVFAAIAEVFQNTEHFQEAGEPPAVQVSAGDGQLRIALNEQRTQVPSPPADWGCEPFHSTRRSGNGLGLFYARRLLAAHGGQLHYTHDPATARLTALITIPLAQ